MALLTVLNFHEQALIVFLLLQYNFMKYLDRGRDVRDLGQLLSAKK